jgi:hypothetical protein
LLPDWVTGLIGSVKASGSASSWAAQAVQALATVIHLSTRSACVSPFHLIYPHGKDNTPSVNVSGKYAIRLFWQGQWRRILVDDRLPVDSNNHPLIPFSASKNEIWIMLLMKALLKITGYQ